MYIFAIENLGDNIFLKYPFQSFEYLNLVVFTIPLTFHTSSENHLKFHRKAFATILINIPFCKNVF